MMAFGLINFSVINKVSDNEGGAKCRRRAARGQAPLAAAAGRRAVLLGRACRLA